VLILCKIWILILSILSLSCIEAQDTYIKRIKINNDRFQDANAILIDSENIFVESRCKCDSIACGIVSKLDLFGNKVYNMPFDSLYGGNRNVLLDDDQYLYYATYSYPVQKYNFVKMSKSDGEVLAKRVYRMDSVSLEKMNVQGFLRTKTGFLISGEILNKSNNKPEGIIYWIDNDFNPIRTTTYNLPNNFNVNAVQDLQPDGYSNLVFATVLRTVGSAKDSLVIRKIDNIGHAIKNVKIPSNTLINERPQFAVNNRGNYVFSHEKNIGVRNYQLVCADTSGNILWTHNYPTKPIDVPTSKFHTYTINQITPTSDDGVIITATIKSNEFAGNYRDAYIGKFDHLGALEWERKINFLDDRDTLFDQCSLIDIKERPDGKGYIAVGSYSPSDTFTISILLVSLDRDGCIEGLECNDGRIIVGTDYDLVESYQNNQIAIYPNPSNGIFNIELGGQLDESPMNLKVRDINGRIVKARFNPDLDLSSEPAGIYFVEVLLDGKIYFKKIVKL
jgi:hypothetical protein